MTSYKGIGTIFKEKYNMNINLKYKSNMLLKEKFDREN